LIELTGVTAPRVQQGHNMSIIRLPIIRHGNTTWDKMLLPESEFDRRLESVRSAMRQRGLEAMVVFSDMVHSGRAAWLINCHVFDPRMPTLVLVTPNGFDGVLKVTARDLIFFKQFTRARLFNVDFLSGDLSHKLSELADEYGLRGRRVGIVGDNYMPANLAKKIRGLFDVGNIEHCDDLYSDLQRAKSDIERGVMRQAADKIETVLADIAAYARPGTTGRALAARADYAARMNGCQDVEFLIHMSNEHASAVWPGDHLPFRPADGKMLIDGDAVGIYLAIQIAGYWVELSQTIFVGDPRPNQIEAHRQAVERYRELLRSLRPDGNYGVDQWNGEKNVVWLHGTGTDRDESPYPATAADKVVSGDLMAAHIAVKAENSLIFVGRQIMVGSDGSQVLFESGADLAIVSSGKSETMLKIK
jgi:Xaa-Pro aminopeptidase